MGRVISWIVVLACIASIGWYCFAYDGETKRVAKRLEVDPIATNADLKRVRELLDAGEGAEALEVINGYMAAAGGDEPLDPQWIDLAISAYEKLGDPLNLMALYRLFPEAFETHEKGSQVIGWARIHSALPKSYEDIREMWRGREVDTDGWWLLDVDYMIANGDLHEARKQLEGRTLPGEQDADRLVRLAVLVSKTDYQQAWNLLHEALIKDPDNPEVRSRRAELAELAENFSLAQAEYMAAQQLRPKSPMLRDQLAEFYRRNEQYGLALKVWVEGLERPTADEIWLKSLFWSRVAAPIDGGWDKVELPPGRFQGFVKYLIDLPPFKFWDDDAFANISAGGEIVSLRQEGMWLRLIELLRTSKEREALELIYLSDYGRESWAAELELQLKRILSFRLLGKLKPDAIKGINVERLSEKVYEPFLAQHILRHQYFRALNEAGSSGIVDDNLADVLRGDSAFAAAFLAAGWLETALHLQRETVVDVGSPDWIAFGLAQALRKNRGPNAALAFATMQETSVPLNLLIGELLIEVGSPEEGAERLAAIKDDDTDFGFRAAWLLVNQHIKDQEYANAKKVIGEHEALSKHILGRESMARIAMLEGDNDLADKLYAAIMNESTEAKSYLARRAFAEQNWKKAQRLTEELLMEYPNHPVLRENLKRIMQAQAN